MNDQFLCFKGCSHRSSYSGLQEKNFLIGIVKFSRSNEGAALTFRKDKRWRKWSDITRYVTGSLAGNTSCQRSCRMNRRVASGHPLRAGCPTTRQPSFAQKRCWAYHFYYYRLTKDFFSSVPGTLKGIHYVIGGKRPSYQVNLVSPSLSSSCQLFETPTSFFIVRVFEGEYEWG